LRNGRGGRGVLDYESPIESGFTHVLSFLVLDMRGGTNRARILKLLLECPRNAYSLSRELGLNYGTVTSHLRKLVRYGVVVPVTPGPYARGYAASQSLVRNRTFFYRILKAIGGPA